MHLFAPMLSIVWRLVAMCVLALFVWIPIFGWALLPIELYLGISLAAHVWRRVNQPPSPPLADSSRVSDDLRLKLH